MREKKFTGGDWRTYPGTPEVVVFDDPEGLENLFTENADGYFCCQNEHDANLITASKKLLEATEEMSAFLEILMSHISIDEAAQDAGIGNIYEKMRERGSTHMQAIAQAYGEKA